MNRMRKPRQRLLDHVPLKFRIYTDRQSDGLDRRGLRHPILIQLPISIGGSPFKQGRNSFTCRGDESSRCHDPHIEPVANEHDLFLMNEHFVDMHL